MDPMFWSHIAKYTGSQHSSVMHTQFRLILLLRYTSISFQPLKCKHVDQQKEMEDKPYMEKH